MSLTSKETVQQVAISIDPQKWGTDSYYFWPRYPDGILLDMEYFNKTDIHAALVNSETEAVQMLVQDADYDVTDPAQAGDKYLYPLISLTDKYGSANAYDYMCIWREGDYLQQEDFSEGARINPVAIKTEFSRLYSLMHELRDSENRSIHVGKTDQSLPDSTIQDESEVWKLPPKGERAGKVLSFGEDGRINMTESFDYEKTEEEFKAVNGRLDAVNTKLDGLSHISITNSEIENMFG